MEYGVLIFMCGVSRCVYEHAEGKGADFSMRYNKQAVFFSSAVICADDSERERFCDAEKPRLELVEFGG